MNTLTKVLILIGFFVLSMAIIIILARKGARQIGNKKSSDIERLKNLART